jgi:hypothetical protein
VGSLLAAEIELANSPATDVKGFKFAVADVANALNASERIWTAFKQLEGIPQAIATLDELSKNSQGVPLEDQRARQREQAAKIMVAAASAIREFERALESAKLMSATPNLTKGMDAFVATTDIVAKLLQEDWGGAALGSVTLVDLLLAGSSTDAELVKANREKFREQIQAAMRLIPLVVEIANAESSAEVATAIEAAAAPTGSYRSKYEHWTLSLNAMVGFAGGGELVSSEGAQKLSGAIAGFAPIGLHAAVPLNRRGECKRCRFHLGAMISVIDLGAMTTYRLTSELEDGDASTTTEAEQAPQIGLAQVFSPGGFLTLGLFRSPIVLGLGVAMSPRLRRITVTDDMGAQLDERDATPLRVMGFIAFDITMFQFR